MSRRIVLLFIVAFLVLPSVAQEPQTIQTKEDEIAALRAEIAELKALIADLVKIKTQGKISIGVMPIQDAGRIPQVGNSFRQLMISALNEAGIKAQESLDEETLKWVQRQDQLVRERWIDPVSAPRRGELRGVTHYLLATVTDYREDYSDLIIGGVIRVVGGGARVRTGSLVVDWRLVDATTGEVRDAFRTEAKLKLEEIAGGIILGSSGFATFSRKLPMPEVASRICARQAAERIAQLFNPQPVLKEKPSKKS